MDEKDFRKHLKDLAQGHHHPEEHDWPAGGAVRVVETKAKKAKTKTGKKSGRQK
jgi:hypothetical protein